MGFDSFVSRSEELLESDGDMCEESTKFRIVSPFLRECGWDLQSIEVIPEYSISIGTGTKHADFALMGESSVRVLVEVKSASSEITSRNVKQLKSYMRQEIGVKWGLITNGKSYKLFTKNDDNSESEFLEFDLKDLEDNLRFVEVIKKENIKTGESENIRKDISSIRESKENIRNEE